MTFIKIDNLSINFYHKKYDNLFSYILNIFKKDNEEVQSNLPAVLDDINLEINEGEIVGIIGRNGIGKSTLLKVIAGIYPPSKGVVTISGQVNALIELGIGFDENQSGLQNIFLIASLLGYSKSEIQSKLDAIIGFSELEHKIHMPLKNYSSGMRSRLFFSIATEIVPDILILDEVFATGDAKFIKKATSRIKGIIEQAKIVLIVSHNKQRIKELCTRCLVLNTGHIVFDGDVDDAYDVYETL